jgi:chaperonin cofactor prefoldin
MVERFKREVSEHGDLLLKGIFALLNLVFGMVTYEYSRVTGEIRESVEKLEARVDRIDQARGESAERLRSVEDATTHLNRDLDRIGKSIDSLNDKLDRVIQQTMHPGAHNTVFPL